MTVEQFWLIWSQGVSNPDSPTVSKSCMFEFANAHAAAQLAEKERVQKEMAESFLTQQKESQRLNAEWVKRAMAAEQRLQEAQAENDELVAKVNDIDDTCDELREKLVRQKRNYDHLDFLFTDAEEYLADVQCALRQREAEAELEQLRAQITGERSTS